MIPTRVVVLLLRLTAVLNIVAGLASVAWPALNTALLIGPDVAFDTTGTLYHRLVWGFVAAMGVGYGLAARDPERQTAMIIAGGLGKLTAAALWTAWLVQGLGGPALLGGVLFDGALGLVFLAWAWGRRKGAL